LREERVSLVDCIQRVLDERWPRFKPYIQTAEQQQAEKSTKDALVDDLKRLKSHWHNADYTGMDVLHEVCKETVFLECQNPTATQLIEACTSVVRDCAFHASRRLYELASGFAAGPDAWDPWVDTIMKNRQEEYPIEMPTEFEISGEANEDSLLFMLGEAFATAGALYFHLESYQVTPELSELVQLRECEKVFRSAHNYLQNK
jgi:hypothetical protein